MFSATDMSSMYLTRRFRTNHYLWFEDGDTYVCARRSDSGELYFYKLYREMLDSYSAGLVNLLDKCLVRSQMYVGNTPYAYLPDEDAVDLEGFFITIHHPIYTFFGMHDPRGIFTRTLPVMKIALKYHAYGVIEALAPQLEYEWPQTLTEWDAAAECDDSPFIEQMPFGPTVNASAVEDGQVLYRTAAAVSEPVAAVQVAHIANIPSILAVAYYHLSRLRSYDARWQEIVAQTGATEDYIAQKSFGVSAARDRWCGKRVKQGHLSEDDLRRLAFGKEQMAWYLYGLMKRLPQELVLHPKCTEAWKAGVHLQSEDPLADLLELCSAKLFLGEHLCSGCQSLINEKGREERERLWENLPQLFSLPVYLR